ncbi:hypothetical protein [Streptomyces sp. NBC_01431]|uniref:hypothetical protein n=1 Tax=Streptomyces sp. NBC_01431 TaxID=2903863 RepID=UPI002E3557FA|nr:hypothetical protein [Streptomyces sp. NBC_01431]
MSPRGRCGRGRDHGQTRSPVLAPCPAGARAWRALDGLPVTIRLVDPPLHEFLPDRTDLAVRIAIAEAQGVARLTPLLTTKP